MSKNHGRACGPAVGIPVGRILLSSVIGVILTFCLTMGGSFLLQREVLPITSCCWLGPVIVAVSAFCAVWLCTRQGDKKLICGLLTAFLYGLTLVVCGMVLFSAPMQPQRMALSAGALLVGSIGAIVLSAVRE